MSLPSNSTQAPACSLAPASPELDCEIGVIGAGFAGLVAAIQLLGAGRSSLAVFERADELGGVWRDNVYPGCACDVRSHLYAIASDPNPDWPSSYARQADILAYLKQVAERRDVGGRIRFGVDIVEARFLEGAGCWRLTDAGGALRHVRMLILATGPLNRPSFPALPGLERFGGTSMHSSAWDTSLDLTGKRVAVIGTGASGVQVIPNIAGQVARLTVFQRSAPWVMPRADRRTTPLERWLFRRVPALQSLVRGAIYWALEGVGSAFFGNPLLARGLRAVALRKLRREVRDPQVRAKLTPDYAIGCKRLTVSDDFLPTFNRDNVELVTDPIAEVTPAGLRTRDGTEHRLDHIVFATGFVVADPDDFLRVVGRNGRVLPEQWAEEGAQAYRGVTVAGYPNLAMLLGPNSALSYSSVIHVVESQMRYVLGYLDALDASGSGAALDVKPDLQAAFNADVQAKLEGTVWASGCRSWYLDRSGRNAGVLAEPGWRYRRRMKRFDAEAYEVVLSAAAP